MTISRRTTLKTLGAVGAGAALTGKVFAAGEHEDDEREPVEEDDEQPDPTEAAVRIAHFSPDAPNVDVYVDGEQVLSDLAYDEVSPYLGIDPGTYTVEITAAGDPETVAFEGEVTLESAFYTIAAIGELEAETFEPLVLVDAGAALVRLVHASPDAPAVDVYAAGADEPLFANTAFGEDTNYVPVPVGPATLEIRPAANGPANEATNDEHANDEHENDQAAEKDEHENDEAPENEEPEPEPDDEPEPENDVVATVDVDLAPGTAYSAYAIGYLEAPADAEGRDFAVSLEVDGPLADVDLPDEPDEPEPEEPEPDEPEEPEEPEPDEPDEPDPEEPEEPEEPDDEEDEY